MIDDLPSNHIPNFSEVRRQLQRVLASPDFVASKTLRRMLEYLVEETIGGRATRLKGYTIGIDIFDRAVDFDVRSDSIVRVTAHKLRQKLAHYYLGAGNDDPVVFQLPKGCYRPTIFYNPRIAAYSVRSVSELLPPNISLPILRIAPLAVAGESVELGHFALALTQQLQITFASSGRVAVIPELMTGESRLQHPLASGESGDQYLLSGLAISDQTELQVFINLHDYVTRAQIWGHKFKDAWNPKAFLEKVEHIAEQTCQMILSSDSPLIRNSAVPKMPGQGNCTHRS